MKDSAETQDTEMIRSESTPFSPEMICFYGSLIAGISAILSIGCNIGVALRGLQIKPFESIMLSLATLAFFSAYGRMRVIDKR